MKNIRGIENTEERQQKYRKIEDILIGTLLGKASLQTYSDGRTWRLRYEEKNEQYIKHLYEIWEEWTGTGPKYIESKQAWELSTKVYPGFTEIAQKFYKKNEKGQWVKRVPKDIELTPRALAYWIMNDGSEKVKTEAYYLSTDSFTKSELDILREKMNKNWGIMVNYHRTKEGILKIYVPKKYVKKLEELVKEYVIDSMKNK